MFTANQFLGYWGRYHLPLETLLITIARFLCQHGIDAILKRLQVFFYHSGDSQGVDVAEIIMHKDIAKAAVSRQGISGKAAFLSSGSN